MKRLLLAGGLFACGPAAPPSLTIVNPTNGATVPLGGDAKKSVSVDFTTKNFTTRASCGGAAACGVVWVLIDGHDCDPAAQTYDAQAVASPAVAEFASCPTPTGPHNLSLELHDSAGNPIKDATGQTVSAGVNVTTQ